MDHGVLIGVDLGTTVLKAAAFDAVTGELLARASRRIPVEVRAEGQREQDTAAVDRSLEQAVATVRQALGDAWDRVAGVGIASQGGSTIIAERETGRPLTPMILWNDARGQAFAHEVAERFPASYWRRFALREAAPEGIGRIMWLLARTPELLTEPNIHIGAGEYLFHKLTGVWRQEAGSAIQIGVYDAARGELDETPLTSLGLPLAFTAPLRRGHETSPLWASGAAFLGLREGIPVAGPYIDQEAGYLGAAAAIDGPLQLSLGTAWVGNFTLPNSMHGESPYQLVLDAATENGRFVVQPLLTGNTGWDWALEQFLGVRGEDAFAKADEVFAESLLPPPGLCVVPWFSQPSPFAPDAYGAGAFAGVNPQTRGADLLRAVALGMACEAMRVFAGLREIGAIDSVVLTGGGRNAAYLRTMLAGLFAPLRVTYETDDDLAVTRGALTAFEGAAKRCRLEEVAAPIPPDRQRLAEAYAAYTSVFDRLYGTEVNGRPYHVEVRGK